MLKTIADYAPSIFGALIVLLIGFLVTKFATRLLRKLLNKLGVDKLSEYINDMKLFGENSLTISLSNILSSFLYYIVLLVVWVAAADVLGIPAISELLNDIIQYIPNLLIAFVYLLIGIFVADLARKFVHTTLQSLGIPSASLISGFIFYFLIINSLRFIGMFLSLLHLLLVLHFVSLLLSLSLSLFPDKPDLHLYA